MNGLHAARCNIVVSGDYSMCFVLCVVWFVVVVVAVVVAVVVPLH